MDRDVLIESSTMVVRRPFFGGGVRRYRGEIVDATGWRTVNQLIGQRYLAPVPYGVTPTTVTIGDSERTFIDDATALFAVEQYEATLAPEEDEAVEDEHTVETVDESGEPVAITVERERPKHTKGRNR